MNCTDTFCVIAVGGLICIAPLIALWAICMLVKDTITTITKYEREWEPKHEKINSGRRSPMYEEMLTLMSQQAALLEEVEDMEEQYE